jgi:hypothetical protein
MNRPKACGLNAWRRSVGERYQLRCNELGVQGDVWLPSWWDCGAYNVQGQPVCCSAADRSYQVRDDVNRIGQTKFG